MLKKTRMAPRREHRDFDSSAPLTHTRLRSLDLQLPKELSVNSSILTAGMSERPALALISGEAGPFLGREIRMIRFYAPPSPMLSAAWRPFKSGSAVPTPREG